MHISRNSLLLGDNTEDSYRNRVRQVFTEEERKLEQKTKLTLKTYSPDVLKKDTSVKKSDGKKKESRKEKEKGPVERERGEKLH